MAAVYTDNTNLLDQVFKVDTIYNVTVSVDFPSMETLRTYSVGTAVIYGVRIGTASILMLVQFLLSSDWKKPVFILNQICLALLVAQSSLYTAYLLGPFQSLGSMITGSYREVTDADVNVSVASSILQTLLVIAIEASLCTQCFSLFLGTLSYFGKYVPWVMTILVALPTSVIWLVQTVSSVRQIMYYPYSDLIMKTWIPKMFLAISIAVFCCLATIKLLYTVRRRWTMGLKRFGPFQIVFIMSAQTMIIPSIFTIVNAVTDSTVASLSNLTNLMVVLFLPLSSLWARYQSTQESSHNWTIPVLSNSSWSSSSSASSSKLPMSELSTPTTGLGQSFRTTLTPQDDALDYNHIILRVDQRSPSHSYV
uniref:ARAD1C29216p n=1 Tax=Blastobotrys adeninivorans TaxID=409370 RepID=A0A060T2K3_BLAAD